MATETFDYIEVPGRAVALALMAEMVSKAINVHADVEDDGGWTFKVETRYSGLVRQMLAKVSA
jgi:CO dehydrogenase/acetyl-CoA synthase gamma subunit (corrinoid Fe-S protein)